jgi:hypothetical protein
MTGRAFPAWLLAAFACLCVPALAAAQSSVSALHLGHFADIDRGQRLRIVSGRGVVEGPFERFAADTLWLQSSQGAANLPFTADSIRTVWVEHGSVARGAVVGGIVGGLGTALYAGLAKASWETDQEDDHSTAIAIIVGAGVGAIIGGVIGKKIPRWHHLYPSP